MGVLFAGRILFLAGSGSFLWIGSDFHQGLDLDPVYLDLDPVYLDLDPVYLDLDPLYLDLDPVFQ